MPSSTGTNAKSELRHAGRANAEAHRPRALSAVGLLQQPG